LEDGFTQIANELLERLAAACLGGKELAVMLLLVRLSYSAVKRKSAALPVRHLSDFLEVNKSAVSKILKNLQNKGLIRLSRAAKGRRPAEYSLQKNWTHWNVQKNVPWPRPMGIKETLEDLPLSFQAEETQSFPGGNSTEPLSFQAEETQSFPGGNSSDQKPRSKSTQNRPSRIGEGGKKKRTPKAPRGDRGGLRDFSLEEIDEAKSQLYNLTGTFPESKDFAKVRAVTQGIVPPDWTERAWRKHCRDVTTDHLRKVGKRKKDGDDRINCVYGVACALAKKQLLTDALHPEEFEGDYDEPA
jgi:predicted transcriptional regulator